MLEYIRKYFEPVPKAPSIEGKDLPEFDRSSKLTSDELEAARIGGSLTKVGGWRQPVKAPIWDHGEGPYPCISHYPGTKMILENINRYDVAASIAPPLVAFGYLYLKHGSITYYCFSYDTYICRNYPCASYETFKING